MALTAQSAVLRAIEVLQDPSQIRWKVDELARHFNSARRQVVIHRPDLAAAKVVHALVAGSRQALPATAAKLLDIPCNTDGPAVTLVPDRRVLDTVAPGWRREAGVDDVLHYLYDERDARTFEVYPPANAGATVDLVCAVYPTDIAVPLPSAAPTDIAGNLDLPDSCWQPVVDYMLFLSYLKDNEFSPDPNRARAHLELFANTLGVELSAVVASSPRSSPGA